MAEENVTDGQGITVVDTDEQIMADALKSFNDEQTPQEPATPDQPEPEVKEEEQVEEKQAEVPETPQSEPPTEVEKPTEVVETAKPETKPMYTPEEIEAEIAEHGTMAHLDSSRLSAEGKLIQASVQRGLTPKLQEAAELRKRFDELVKEKTEIETQRMKEANERKYQEDIEIHGQEMAEVLKTVRDYKTEVDSIKKEREIERQQYARESQRIAAEKFEQAFIDKAPAYGIPVNEEWKEIVLSRVWSENQRREFNGQPFISIEDGLKLVSGTVNPSNIDGIKKILNANPKVLEALENEFKAKFAQKKTAGPTIVKPSGSGGAGGQVPKTAPDAFDPKKLDDPNYDFHADMMQEALKLLEEEQNKNQ